MDPRNRPRVRPRMPMSQRAKIFIPFDPLKGFTQALRAKEREVEEMKSAGNEKSEELP